MDRIEEVLTFLREEKEYVSGDYISARIGISRTAVWKYINRLGDLGYRFAKLKGKGYHLVETPDRLFPWEISRFLDTRTIGRNIIYRETVDSTNNVAFKLALSGEPEGTCVIAETQDGGKGRLGRQWFSPVQKNLYVSVILRPAIHPSGVYPITFLSSLAVFDTIKELTGSLPSLKWPNDVLINGRKVCGTLLEISTEADMVRFVIVGIGLNVNMDESDVGEVIQGKATSLFMETRKLYERPLVCGMLLTNLERHYRLFQQKGATEICAVWEEIAQIKGKQLEINQMGESYKGISEGIDKDGAVLLNVGGKVKKIIAGDVNF
jgi:BirA family transcriptional regulator, biotin operon repressor / biotin---[acetyl-CoA-carboxylase] ligase